LRKRIVSLVAVVVLICALFIQVADARSVNATPFLTFDGTTAYCSASCKSGDPSDELAVTMTLYENGTIVAGWNAWGTQSVSISKTYAATSGATYRLNINYTVNGVKQTGSSITKVCP
jgi:hypothetical protein